MEKRRKPNQLLARTARELDLPADLVAGLPKVELVGNHELRMSNHRGILSYGSEEIHISAGGFLLRVRGEGLELRAMTVGDLLITGVIRGVDVD
ncbi:YabP/YqfC family sporulation protein [Pseudoflavonifractor phocaeensis]|uniref:YabP/YqfC family sporulation protein n=1 Tax=Pseudoflavonifractor phocaeensis TaxID=1870988 RepID=UPI00195D0337|nr:YabP/YqfC family sporulation protein [Pseudoflavonifractor phocaeensis]MBM6870876.1 YabP/YqfC family sporulation protein [Pseudoflavonifractor phocaeensis]MBM6938277.1 YabP/YqfC family sporulation protein [Pseudoflavonifractor phocaeensis]